MLTRELLLYRVRESKVRPSFAAVDRPDLQSLAEDLVAIVQANLGQPREAIEEQLEGRAAGFSRIKVARGLCKLLLDRMDFEEPDAQVAEQRRAHFAAAASVLRTLPGSSTIEDYERRLKEVLTEPLETAREKLYADLPGQRLLLEWKPLGAEALLERYNLALAQGLVLYSGKLVIEAIRPELLRVRRLLRWLKFCRLVAELKSRGDDWTLEVEGPAAILSMQKKYGLQLAMFLSVVPILQRWRLEAEIRLPRREPLILELTHKDPLVPLHDEALGHIPPEVQQIAGKFENDPWKLDLTPMPRPVGVADHCVPDLGFRHEKSGAEVYFELFHQWHRSALQRRLRALQSRPDPQLFLAVDKSLAREPELKTALEESPQVMLFNVFPSEKKVREILARFPTSPVKKRAIVPKPGAAPGQEDKDVESPRSARKRAARGSAESGAPRGGKRRSPGSGSDGSSGGGGHGHP